MKKMGDLLELIRDLAALEYSEEVVERYFGRGVAVVSVMAVNAYETRVTINFANGLVIEARHFLDEGLWDLQEDCELSLELTTDLTSHIRYNVFYGRYNHRTGYIRVDLGDIENRLIRLTLEDFYIPRLKNIYRPIIMEFKGFFSRDFFGVRVDKGHGKIYYSPVRSKGDPKDANIYEVIERLHHLEGLLRNDEFRHRLAELDVQMFFLPNVMWM